MITNQEFSDIKIGDWIEFTHSYVEESFGEVIKINVDTKTLEVFDKRYNYTVKIEDILEIRTLKISSIN